MAVSSSPPSPCVHTHRVREGISTPRHGGEQAAPLEPSDQRKRQLVEPEGRVAAIANRCAALGTPTAEPEPPEVVPALIALAVTLDRPPLEGGPVLQVLVGKELGHVKKPGDVSDGGTETWDSNSSASAWPFITAEAQRTEIIRVSCASCRDSRRHCVLARPAMPVANASG